MDVFLILSQNNEANLVQRKFLRGKTFTKFLLHEIFEVHFELNLCESKCVSKLVNEGYFKVTLSLKINNISALVLKLHSFGTAFWN